MGTPDPSESVRESEQTQSSESLEAELLAAREKIANLEFALVHSRRIGQAIGILMARHSITETDAFERLRTASQHPTASCTT